MDLGRTLNNPGEPITSPIKEGKRTSYPGLTFNDKAAEDFRKEYECDLGDELTATVKLRVNGHRSDEYGQSISFDVLSIDNVQETGSDKEEGESDENEGDEAEGDDAESQMLGYTRPKTKKEIPNVDLSA